MDVCKRAGPARGWSGPLAAALLAAACATTSTRLIDSWKDPAIADHSFQRVAAVALARDLRLRPVAEDEFVKAVGKPGVVASHELIPDAELEDRERARARLLEIGVDGAVVFRVVKDEKRTNWVPPYFSTSGVVTPGYYESFRAIQIETVLYDLVSRKPLWAAHSESIDPRSAEDLIDDIVRLAVEQMRRDGLL